MTEIKVTVNLLKLRDIHGSIWRKWSSADDDNLNFLEWTETVQLNLEKAAIPALKKKISELLLSSRSAGKRLDGTSIEVVIDELIFIESVLRAVPVSKIFTFAEQKTAKKDLKMLVKMLDAIPFVSDNDKLEIKVTRQDAPSIIVKIPQTSRTQTLFDNLANQVVSFLIQNTSNSSLWGYLALNKEPITSDLLKNKLRTENLPEDLNFNMELAFLAITVLKYISTLPQFPPSKKKNSVFSETQGQFLMHYFHLFGHYNPNHKIQLGEPDIDYTSFSKNLRHNIEVLNSSKYFHLLNHLSF